MRSEDFMADNNDGRSSVVLEGMYKGFEEKLEEVKKEVQIGTAQQTSAYEALEQLFHETVEKMLAEVRYISQQNSAIYDFGREDRAAVRDDVLRTMEERAQSVEKNCADAIERAVQSLNARIEMESNSIKDELIRIGQLRSAAPASEAGTVKNVVTELDIDYDRLAEKLTKKLPAVDYDKIRDSVTAANAKAAPVAAAVAAPDMNDFDYDLLAEKISVILPEVDYDTIAERMTALIPQTDENAVAEKVLSALPETDETAIADRVAESIPLVDYDFIAERVASTLENEFDVTVDDKGIEKIAEAVAEGLDYEKIARRVAELLKAEGGLNTVIVQKTVEQAPAEKEIVAAAAPAPKPKPKPAPAPKPVKESEENDGDSPELTTRYKRSFEARIIQSENEIKEYYSDLKNALMRYPKMHSQINWSNERFSFNSETIAKIGVNGKQLCLYLALDPEEFPVTVYHQKFEGDKKMYEKTPMMVKIKSPIGLKRAVRLIALLMERNGAVPTDKEALDYASVYPYKTDEELLDEGLIKTSLMVKSDLDF